MVDGSEFDSIWINIDNEQVIEIEAKEQKHEPFCIIDYDGKLIETKYTF